MAKDECENRHFKGLGDLLYGINGRIAGSIEVQGFLHVNKGCFQGVGLKGEGSKTAKDFAAFPLPKNSTAK